MSRMTEWLQQDAAARVRALELASFIVEAPAGAGKTELLTQRYLKLLARVEQPEEVMAITFTNKAAAEMRDRILSRLADAGNDAPPGEPHLLTSWQLARAVLQRDCERDWQILAHPGRLRVTTIDALCASLARQMPYLSRFGAPPAVVTEARPYYEQAARRTIELVEGADDAANTVAEALEYHDNDAGALERLLTEMLARRDQWLHHAHRIDSEAARREAEQGLEELLATDLQRACAFLPPRVQELIMPAARLAAANWPDVAALIDWQTVLQGSADELPQWQALAKLLTLDSKPEFRGRLNASQGFPASDKQAKELGASLTAVLDDLRQQTGAIEAMVALKKLPLVDLQGDWAMVECFARLLRLAAGQLWLVFQEAGEVDFTEIAFQARRALGEDEEPTDLALALDYRIQHLLVDEFQDTSPSQVDLLARLTRGWQPGDGRTLFVVGDPMQSIYRFRKAEVGLFLRVQAQGIGDIRLEALRLYRNNRSCPGVVAWINQTFPQIFAPVSDAFAGAVAYNHFVASKPEESSAQVHFHALLDQDENTLARRAEAAKILEIIEQTRQQHPEANIAVLVRGRDHLSTLVSEIRLQQAGLRYMAVEIEALSGRQGIQDLISLSRALLHRGDRVHWLAVLRAPWCGLTLADLHALVGGVNDLTVWQCMQADQPRFEQLSADGQQRLAHCRAILGEALANAGRQTPRRWIEGVWHLLNGPACLGAASEQEDSAAYFDLIDQLVAEGKLTPEVLEERVAKLYAAPDPQADARLQFMTIHKAKGLEFDTVIVPGLDRQPASSSNPLLVWGELPRPDGEPALLVAPRRRHGSAEATPYTYLCDWEANRRAHEDERLLYVAATRAVRCLHWLAAAKPKGAGELAKPHKASLLRLLWEPLAEAEFLKQLSASAPVESSDQDSNADFVPDLIRLATVALPAVYQQQAALVVTEEGLSVTTNGIRLNLDASVGTLLHRCLEKVVKEGLEQWPAERIDAMPARLTHWLQQQGHSKQEAVDGAQRVAGMLRQTLASTTGRWILQTHEADAAELALSRMEEGGVVQHIIDRTFIADGVRWIIDYKTSRPADGNFTLLAESYRPQLERYAGLFAGDPVPVRCAVYFVAQDQWVELA